MPDVADMEIRETGEQLLFEYLHPPQWLYPVEFIPSEEVFGVPRVLHVGGVQAHRLRGRGRRGLRPSDRSVFARRCARCGTPAAGANAPIWAGSDLCAYCEHVWLSYEAGEGRV